MRDNISAALKQAQKDKNVRSLSTLRLIIAAIHDRDIALRGKGKDKADEAEILEILARMVKQREESSKIYADAGRAELARQELEEIDIIREFMPKQLNDAEMEVAIAAAISASGAESLRDMGKVMAVLKAQYAGKLDFSQANALVRAKLQ